MLKQVVLRIITESFVLVHDYFVGSNTFIGARAGILPGTVIGNNCIIRGQS